MFCSHLHCGSCSSILTQFRSFGIPLAWVLVFLLCRHCLTPAGLFGSSLVVIFSLLFDQRCLSTHAMVNGAMGSAAALAPVMLYMAFCAAAALIAGGIAPQLFLVRSPALSLIKKQGVGTISLGFMTIAVATLCMGCAALVRPDPGTGFCIQLSPGFLTVAAVAAHVYNVHVQRQVPRKRRAESSGVGPGPGPGPGGGPVWLGECRASLRPAWRFLAHCDATWATSIGTAIFGLGAGMWYRAVGNLCAKGWCHDFYLPRDPDDVGVVWESRSGYETASATPGHVCLCSYNYGRGPVLPQANPSVFTEAVNLWSRVASLLTPWCAKGEVPTGVNLNRYPGNGSCIPWHCDNEPLFGSPFEPKVIVSMSLGHSALFKLRRRASENTPSQIRLDHGDLLVMDGLTQYEYVHSTASELEGPRVNLTYRWISQHIRSCPLAGLIGGALPSDAQDLAEPHSRVGGSRKSKCP